MLCPPRYRHCPLLTRVSHCYWHANGTAAATMNTASFGLSTPDDEWTSVPIAVPIKPTTAPIGQLGGGTPC